MPEPTTVYSIFKFLFGSAFVFKNAVKSIFAQEGVSEIHNVFVSSFKSALKKAKNDVTISPYNIASKQLQYLVSLNRNEIVAFLQDLERSGYTINQILSDETVLIQLYEVLDKLLLDKHSNDINYDICSKILKETLKTFKQEIYTNISEKQGIYLVLKSIEGNEDLLKALEAEITKEFGLISDKIDETVNEIKNHINESIEIPTLEFINELKLEAIEPFFDELSEDINISITNHDYDSAIKKSEILLEKIEQNKINDPKLRTNIYHRLHLCYNRKEEFKKSSEYLIKCYKIMPENPQFIWKAAIEYQNLGNIDKSDELINKLIEEHQDSVELFLLKLYFTWNRRKELEFDLDQLIEKELKAEFLSNVEVCFGIAKSYQAKRNLEQYKFYMFKALELKCEQSTFLKVRFAFNLSHQYLSKLSLIGHNIFDLKAIENLNIALKLYLESWEELKDSTSKIYWSKVLVNISAIYIALEDNEKAIKYIDDAISISKARYEYYFSQRAKILLKQGKKIESINEFAKIKNWDNINVTEDLLIYLPLLYSSNTQINRDLALEIMKTKLQSLQQSKTHLHLSILYCEILLNKDEIKKADEIVRTIKNTYPINILILITESKILNYEDNIRANYKIREAIDLAPSSNDVFHLLKLGQLLIDKERFEEAIYILELIPKTRENLFIIYQDLLFLYYSIQRFDKALSTYKELREEYGLSKDFTTDEIDLLWRVGKYNESIKLLEEYYLIFPNDINVKLKLCRAYLAQRNVISAARVNLDLDITKYNINQFETLLDLLLRLNRRQEAINLIYQRWRIDKGKELCELIVVKFSLKLWATKEALKPETIMDNCVFYLSDRSKKRQEYIVYNKDDADFESKFELNYSHELYSEVLGNKEGDIISRGINQFSGEEEFAKIEDIISTYQYVYIKAIGKLRNQYKNQSSIWISSYDSPEEGVEEITKFIEKSNNELEQINNKKTENELLDKYQNFHLPLGLLAFKFNTSPIALWYSFAFDENIGICASFHSKEELLQIQNFEKSNKPICLDLTSILSLYYSDSSDHLVEYFGKFRMTQSTMDKFNEVYEISRYPISFNRLVIYNVNTPNVRHKMNSKAYSLFFEDVDKILEWISNYCHEPEIPDAKLRSGTITDEENSIKKYFGESFFDTLNLVKEKNYTLLSDDCVFRNICNSHYQITSIWSTALIISVRNKLEKKEKKALLNQAIVNLIKKNYKYFLPDEHTISFAVEDEENFNAALKMLSSPYSHDFLINLVLALLFSINSNDLLQNNVKSKRTNQLLDTFVEDKNVTSVYIELKNRLSDNLLNLKDMTILERIDMWWSLWCVKSMASS